MSPYRSRNRPSVVKLMAAREKGNEVEWVGGLVSLPAYVTGEGAPYRPEAVIWLGADGAVLGTTVGKPGEALAGVGESLRDAIEHPMWGQPHVPARVRVASPEFAAALREGHPGLEVVCAPTPEIDAVLAAMREGLGADAKAVQSFLPPGVGPDAVAAFFRAAAALFRAKPWRTLLDDRSLVAVTLERFGVRDAALSVIGQLGESLGFILFSGIDDFETYLDAADAVEHGEAAGFPPFLAMNYERVADLDADLRKELAAHGWEVAAVDACPWLVVVDKDLVSRPPTADELTMAEAIALALPRFMRSKKLLHAAWSGGTPVARTLCVRTHAGEVEVSLRVPHGEAPSGYAATGDVLAGLAELVRRGDELDPDAREPLEEELVRRFAASPEASGLTGVDACYLVMDFAADYLGATIATLRPAELRRIVFELIPRKVSTDASAARYLVEETRAFYAFLKREFGLRQADACLRVLGGDAVKRLQAALSNPSNFGMAKSLVMAGREAGFDVDSQEGLEAWMQEVQSKPLPASVRLPLSGAASPSADRAAARSKKTRRKTARKARKRNR
ncbi:hypothetical protein P2318_00680 [Myxococcaceae bacterium GXIMD 01537]